MIKRITSADIRLIILRQVVDLRRTSIQNFHPVALSKLVELPTVFHFALISRFQEERHLVF